MAVTFCNHSDQMTMTLLGSITGSDDGWTFSGEFGPFGGPPIYKIKGGLNKPIKDLSVRHAKLFNADIGSYSYVGEIGFEYFNIRSTSMPEIIITGKLGSPITPVPVAGWLQIAEA
ncbi:hypothetical protein APHAL10511_005313 [Amanita phalloides]|nr:hypothetical protein APHAL10511_005313 [Amanita phalloides]